MPENIFDAAQRNIELIVELMDIVGVHDCEELVDKVRELQSAAQQGRAQGRGESPAELPELTHTTDPVMVSWDASRPRP